MRPLRFKRYFDGVYKYHYISEEPRVIEKNWPGLFGEWNSDRTPMSEFNVNSNDCEEVAVYLGLTWRLSSGLCRYGIP